MITYHYAGNCVGTPPESVPTLTRMIDDNLEITRRTFLRRVDRDELAGLAEGLGYAKHPSQGLTMAADWSVSYHRSHWNGRRCYYFRWSAIEYYFFAVDD